MLHMADGFDFAAIEGKWRSRWERDGIYRTPDQSDKPKYYAMEMLPYPSGDLARGAREELHAGRRGRADERMLGYNVLHPMGWDAFGLPAENAAIAARSRSRGVDGGKHPEYAPPN